MPRPRRSLLASSVPVLAAAVLAGCGDGPHVRPGVNPIAAVVGGRYPVRTDWVVKSPPSVQPPRWNTPGYPPLKSLSLGPNTPDADLAAGLRTERDKKNLLDPTQIEGGKRAELAQALDSYFGTPAAPAVRIDPAEIKKLELDPPVQKLVPAAAEARDALGLDGAPLARGSALYTRWCLQCHGPSGAGDGPSAFALQPQPRDYRQGVFNYVSTAPDPASLGKPRRSDLKETIRRGLDGSAMPAFPHLTAGELDDLSAYVIHLAVRGESEYQTMRRMLPQEAEDFGVVPQEVASALVKALAAWGKAQQLPVPVSPDNCSSNADRLASAAAGFKAYQEFGCAACHANYGRTALLRYNAWGTVAQPRNFVLGVYRGGRRGDDLYARIYTGIPGAGMPGHKEQLEKATREEGKPDKVWNIVHFLQAIGDPDGRAKLASKHGVALE